MNQKELDTHVRILGWIHIISNAIFLVIGGLVFLLLTSIGMFSGDSEAFGILSVVAIFVTAVMAIVALPGILAGVGLLRRASWGRILALVVGVLGLFNVPIGTIIGVYTLWVLLQQEATAYFSQPKMA
ncbi:MAG: hypothetical protein R3300_12400 [Candidatus Promineifilaceae bacterium]|nr:hypothetical protein [Candidatus Promineifilaceae bacterium]